MKLSRQRSVRGSQVSGCIDKRTGGRLLFDVTLLAHVDTVEELTDILVLHEGGLLDLGSYGSGQPQSEVCCVWDTKGGSRRTAAEARDSQGDLNASVYHSAKQRNHNTIAQQPRRKQQRGLRAQLCGLEEKRCGAAGGKRPSVPD